LGLPWSIKGWLITDFHEGNEEKRGRVGSRGVFFFFFFLARLYSYQSKEMERRSVRGQVGKAIRRDLQGPVWLVRKSPRISHNKIRKS
jgi:hypothetical protein